MEKVLKQRLITAIILAPLVMWGVLALPNGLFAVLLGVIMVMGAWEWAGLAQLRHGLSRRLYPIVIAAIIAAIGYFGANSIDAVKTLLGLVILAISFWGVGWFGPNIHPGP